MQHRIPNTSVETPRWAVGTLRLGTVSGGWKELRVEPLEMGQEVRDARHCKLQTATAVPSHRSNTHGRAYFASKLSLPVLRSVSSRISEYFGQSYKHLLGGGTARFRLLRWFSSLFPSHSVSFVCWPRWTKGGRHGI